MGTPFIIIIFAIIFVCIAIAIIVAVFMRTNGGFGSEETANTPIAPADNLESHSMTGPLPPFMPLPHQTQPLSEIYYYNEQAPQTPMLLTPSDPHATFESSAQNTSDASPPHMPPTL